jgi:hypothetical protein
VLWAYFPEEGIQVDVDRKTGEIVKGVRWSLILTTPSESKAVYQTTSKTVYKDLEGIKPQVVICWKEGDKKGKPNGPYEIDVVDIDWEALDREYEARV